MTIRRATPLDLEGINSLLKQVHEVHYEGRPDLFKPGMKKHPDDVLLSILQDDKRPVFVAVPAKDSHKILGYIFCVLEDYIGDYMHADIRTLYIDDLCVDEASRGQGIGSQLYHWASGYAAGLGCHNVTLNVWTCNPRAMGFYEHLGLKPYKICMEKIIDYSNPLNNISDIIKG
ncbi:MAG: GNAT family N-acetyltransferase [Clostridia bacterium]|nr:GNAT family N-acetyltransferase [Clostridia bacterium]